MGFTYGAGALIAADRNERRMWIRHRVALERREIPVVPAGVVAQTWRGGARQAQLARLLLGCGVEALDEVTARACGVLASTAETPDVIVVSVVEGALRRGDVVVTSDPDDLRSIAASIGRRVEVVSP
jgi:hypothetical protein